MFCGYLTVPTTNFFEHITPNTPNTLMSIFNLLQETFSRCFFTTPTLEMSRVAQVLSW